MDGGAFANGRMDAPLSDCGKKQTAERKALNSYTPAWLKKKVFAVLIVFVIQS